MRAGVGLGAGERVLEAASSAAEQALAGAGRPDFALVFAAPERGADVRAMLAAVSDRLGTDALVGASAHGVLAAGREHEGAAAAVVVALSGLEAHSFLLHDLRGHEADAGAEIAAQLGGPPRAEDLVLLLPDPHAFDSDPLLAGIGTSLAPALAVGAGASDSQGEPPLQWCGRDVETGALAGAVLRAASPPRIGVTQACQPVTELLTATRTQGHWVLELDGRPALDVYREAARGPLAEDLARAALFVLAALPVDGSDELRPGSYLVRNVAGFAPERGAFALPTPARTGQRIGLALREPETARDDLKAMLAGLSGTRPALGLYFDCCARGAGFFGVSGLEAGYLEQAFGDAPLAGMFGSCEIGPVGGRPELLTYTGVLALLDDDG